MEVGGVHASQLVFVLLLLVVVAFGALARRLQAPYPIVLLVAGLLVSFVPGIPRATLDPDVIFFVVLPPLLYASAWTTSWREFSFNFVSITSLAVGLVGFTVAGVAVAAPWILPGFDWRDRKSTRLNSSHGYISYAVFCLKKKNKEWIVS